LKKTDFIQNEFGSVLMSR